MENTIEKLNQNKLMELTKQDYENISNNMELKTLFLTKVKEGHKFNFDDVGSSLEEELLSSEFVTYLLDIIKEDQEKEFVTFCFTNKEELNKEFDQKTAEVIYEYIQANIDYALSELPTLEQQYGKIYNKVIIDFIIKNKLEQHYGSIYMDPPTAEFEELLINALDRNQYYYIYTINLKILQKCIETGNTKAAMHGIHPNNPEEANLIFSALDNNLISYNELDYKFKTYHKKDVRLIKHQIRNNELISLDEELAEHEDIRIIIKEEIEKNHELANNWQIINIGEKSPEIGLTIIKHCSKDKLKDMFRFNSTLISNLLQNNKEELIDSLIYNLEHNQSAIEEVIFEVLYSFRYTPKFRKEIAENPVFFNFFISKIPLEKILKLLISYDPSIQKFSLPQNIHELLSKANVSFEEIPYNFNFEINYPENVWLSIIPRLEKEQLIPDNIKLDRFTQQEKIFDAILTRLKELKSNVYNTSLEYWNGPTTETLIDIVCDPNNPLNLSTTQKFRILPSSKMKNTKYLVEIVKQTDKITNSDLKLLIPTLLTMENIQEIEKICNIIFPKLEKTDDNIVYLSSIAADVYGTLKQNEETPNISKQHITIYNCLKNYIKTQNDIPLRLSRNFDKEIIEEATYKNLEALSTNPNFFLINDIAPRHFIDFIYSCQSKNLPINLKLLHQVAKSSVGTKPYDYENITFSNDEETYSILYKLLNKKDEDSIERKVVTNWVNNWLDYKFFDCQLGRTNNDLLELLLIYTEYTDKILEIINPEKIKDNTVINSRITSMLITEQDSPEQSQKVLNTIIKLIECNKLDRFNPKFDVSPYINLIDHPTFVNYVINTYINSIEMHMENLEIVIQDKKYKQAVIDALYKKTHLANNINVLNLIDKLPEIKEYVKYSLEHDNNGWLEFNSSYLDPKLLTAYLKNHSIDKVITFIVHNQNINAITEELYTIIKSNFLEKHPEYNKESYDLLETFYGHELLLLLETENFIKLLQKDKEIVSKFIEIFRKRELDEGIITSINDSLRQNYFSIENSNIINFYTNTLEKIQRGITEEEIQEVINNLINYIPNNLDKELEETGNELLLNTYKVNKHDFLRMLINELINNQNIYATVFNKITNNLIVQKRNEYRSSQNIYRETNLKYELETKSLYNALFNYLTKNKTKEIISIIKDLGFDTELNIKTIYFLNGDSNHYSNEELPKIKRNIPILKTIIFDAFDLMNEKDKEREKWNFFSRNNALDKKFPNLPKRYEDLLEIPEFAKIVKKIPIYPSRITPIDMFGNINIEAFETLANDEEKFKTLIGLLNKYKFLEWQDLFDPTIKKLSLGEDTINIFNFINAFNKIYENEKKIILRDRKKLIDIVVEELKKSGKTKEEIADYIKVKEAEPININITAYKILKYCTIYSSIANYYKIILGLEDFDLVKRNDGPNSSYYSAEDRLTKATELQIKMIELDKITIPSFRYEHQLNHEKTKKLAVTVGNRGDSRNLTHGERTGACMRAYGHAHSLFEFCNTDPRGFHIVFTDPETNEYVSRVSGFRNGNTVFLNELRYSINPKYTNDDVVEACKAVARELIEKTKESDMPIENVVASPFYALGGYQTQQLSEYNISEGVYNGYKDVSNNAVVLATTGKNGLAVPLKLNGENQPIYESVRLLPREYPEEKITDATKISLQRITAIKECLENKDNPEHYKTIDLNYELLETIFIYVIIGQDWYVALDSNGTITHDIAIQNEHSITELNEAIAKINGIKEEKIKIGGLANGIQ